LLKHFFCAQYRLLLRNYLFHHCQNIFLNPIFKSFFSLLNSYFFKSVRFLFKINKFINLFKDFSNPSLLSADPKRT
jgi:hypothetical protein